MKNFKPKKNYVLIWLRKNEQEEGLKKSKGGLYMPNDDKQDAKEAQPGKYDFIISAVGPEVENVKEGDYVIFNEYDVKFVQDEDEEKYGLTKEDSIFATYE